MKIAVIQINSIDDEVQNCRRIESLIREAAKKDAEFIILPEVAFYRGKDANRGSDTIPGRISGFLSNLSKELRIWIHSGSIAEKDETNAKLFNTSFIVNPLGEITAKYRKINLFEIQNAVMKSREADVFSQGEEKVLAKVSDWNVGMLICFDLRFGSLWRSLRKQNAELFVVPANFTYRTGKDHWEILLRARAIELQSFVAAPAQWGEHHGKNFSAFGNSMIIGPWGEIIASASDKDDAVLVADISKLKLEEIRSSMKIF